MIIKELKNDAKVKLSGNYWKTIAIYIIYELCAIVLALLATGIAYLLTKNNESALSSILQLIVAIMLFPLSYGLLSSYIKLSRGDKVSYSDFITDGFAKFSKVWAVFGRTLLKLILPIILVIISFGIFIAPSFLMYYEIISNGVGTVLTIIGGLLSIASLIYLLIKVLSYSLTNYVLFDNPDTTAKEIVNTSSKYMKGNKWNFILVGLSFILYYLGIYLLSYIAAYLSTILSSIVLFVTTILLQPYISFTLINFYEEVKQNNTDNSDEVISE
jgi:uncharacterized membrane protein